LTLLAGSGTTRSTLARVST